MKKINIRFLFFISLFVISLVGYSQTQVIQFDHETQRNKLEGATSSLFEAINPKFNASGQPAYQPGHTYALLQLPSTNTFILAINGQTVPKALRKPSLIKAHLVNWGFKDVFNGDSMTIEFVSSVGNTAINQTTNGETFRILRLPSRKTPTIVEGVANVHAEMTMIAALAHYYISEDPGDSGKNYVIQSNRPYCPRCYGYLKQLNFYVPDNPMVIQEVFSESWSLPNYNVRANTIVWKDWIRTFSFNYTIEANRNGLVDGTGMFSLMQAVPQQHVTNDADILQLLNEDL